MPFDIKSYGGIQTEIRNSATVRLQNAMQRKEKDILI
jgi:hypothetical protein